MKEQGGERAEYPHGTINPFLCLNTHENFHVHSSAFIVCQIIPRGSIQLAVKILEKCWKIFFLLNDIKVYEEDDSLDGRNRSP